MMKILLKTPFYVTRLPVVVHVIVRHCPHAVFHSQVPTLKLLRLNHRNTLPEAFTSQK